MLHGIDYKTHSQCQRRAGQIPALTASSKPGPDFVSSSLENVGPRQRTRFATMAGGAYRDRTDDPLLAKQVLSQLS